jgi:Cd2+/Zn2+-exporting ATPase
LSRNGGEPAHPLELGLRLHENVCREKTPPVLARAMCASPFDAALHDAVGIATGRSAFDFYRDPVPMPTADPHFRDRNAAAAIARAIERPKRELRAWYLVGKADDIYGLIALKDQPRPEAKQMVADLHAMDIRTVMLTGDNEVTANAVAKDLGIAEVRASLKPEGKIAAIRELKSKYGAVAMIGDGVNDAPALAEATVGIAMGAAGTDAAIEAADVALMADDLSKVPYALRIGRRSNRLGRQNIVFALSVLAIMIPSALVGILSVALAVIFHEASELIAVGNGLRVGKRGDGGRIIE